jgi:hypothetical protein
MEKYVSITNNERICYETVNKCPICNSSIAPVEKSKFFNSDSKMYFFMFECPACNKGFITHYNYTNERKIKNDISYNMLKLVNSYPKVPELHQFDENIKKLSSNFCEIFNQAYVAEQMNLNEIAGIGYRKALEFLIKDYCIDKNKEQEEKIKKEPLSQVITNYILSDKIKNLAKASIWIGNDETHYVRKYEDKDIKDLKRFISATVAYITYELIADSAQEFVNN